MPDIIIPQAVNFSNNSARVIANALASLDRTIPQFLIYVVRDFEDHTGLNLDADPIIDGAQTDGRPPVTKLNVAELKFVCEQIKGAMDTDNRRALLNKWVDQGKPIF